MHQKEQSSPHLGESANAGTSAGGRGNSVDSVNYIIVQQGPLFRYTGLALLMATLMYLLPGVIGHDPWKQDETYTFGIIGHFLRSGEWLIPMNAGQPFMEKPPLYMWVASALAWALNPWLTLHDGARLASAFFGAVGLICGAYAARISFGTTSLRDPQVIGTVALMAGTLVFIKHVHDMFSDVALMAGTALALCGILHIVNVSQNRLCTKTGLPAPEKDANAYGGSAALGIGVGVAVMSKGVFIPAIFFATLLVLPLLLPACRHKHYLRAVVLAILVSTPFVLIWPALLYRASPTLFMSWFWDNNVGRFLGFSVAQLGSDNEPGFVLKAIMTSGFPVAPLALAALVLGGWRQGRSWFLLPAMVVPLVFSVIGLTVLSCSATARQLYLLPFVLPGALIAAHVMPRIPATAAWCWDWLSRMVFGLLGLLVWAIWWLMQQPVPLRDVIGFIDRWLPIDYPLLFSPGHVIAAFVISGAWVALLLTLRTQGVWRAALSWAAGLTLVWGLTFTLLLPWIDHAKSYGPVFARLKIQMLSSWEPNDCMASIGLGESEAPMLYYYTDILPQPVTSALDTTCRWLITEGRQRRALHAFPGWQPFWQGFRDGDTRERLEVLRRSS